MKKLFTTKIKLTIAAALLFALVAAISSAIMLDRAPAITNAVGIMLSPFRKGVSVVANKIGDAYTYFYEFDTIKNENEELKRQLAEMEELIRASRESLEENDRLRLLVGLKERRQDLVFENASLLSWNLSNWGSGFMISKGESKGIKAGMGVVTETGALIGLVTETGLNWANVATIIDVESEIGAVVARTGDVGIAEGGFELMQGKKLRLSYLTSDAELRNGDELVTTGGELLPAGLLIGKVVDVMTEDSGVSKFAVIEPAAELEGLTHVYVISSFDVEQ